MPIKSLTDSHFVQVCAVCSAEHTIAFDRAGQKTKKGPFALKIGDTLEVKVDAALPVTVTFAEGDFPDFSAVTPDQLAKKLAAAVAGIAAREDGGGSLIESATTGAASRVEVTGGSARAALGFPTDGRGDVGVTRPVLGVAAGPQMDPNVVALRRCGNCGANECLIRSFDAAPAKLDGSHFAEHRKAVNTLAQHFKAQGFLHPALAAIHETETRVPVDIHPALTAAPITLSVPIKAALRGGEP